jgi:hypothetical protein
VGRLAVYVVLCFAPTIAFYLGMRALLAVSTWSGPPWRRSQAPHGPSLQRLVSDLRRLEADYRRIEASDLPARAARLRSVTLAYDDTLTACCRALDLPEPEKPPLGPVERLQTEAALAQHGLTW